MSNFICSECGIVQIDCGYAGYKTPKEIELEKKVHILNEANMQLENAIGSQADFFRQQISVLESQLSEANKVIKFYSDATGLTEEERQMSSEKYHLVYGLKACDYLEKYGME